MPFRRRHRQWVALIALIGLLFQQLAMASYACPVDTGDMAAAVASQMPPCHSPDTADKSRCHQHCHPLAQTSDHGSAPTVPPALLPPTTWLRAAAFIAADRNAESDACSIDARSTAPPLTIRYCTFQI